MIRALFLALGLIVVATENASTQPTDQQLRTDWANLGKPERMGGAITAAVFLWQFIKGTPWVHLDIAPRMTAMDGEFLAKGAAGSPVRLLVRFLEEK